MPLTDDEKERIREEELLRLRTRTKFVERQVNRGIWSVLIVLLIFGAGAIGILALLQRLN